MPQPLSVRIFLVCGRRYCDQLNRSGSASL